MKRSLLIAVCLLLLGTSCTKRRGTCTCTYTNNPTAPTQVWEGMTKDGCSGLGNTATHLNCEIDL